MIPKIIPDELKKTIRRYHTQYPLQSFAKLAQLILNHEQTVREHYGRETFRKIVSAVLQEKIMEELEEKEIKIPETLYSEPEFYELPIDDYSILILGDIHFPFHNKLALELAIGEGKRRDVRTILLNGDMLDFYGISFFARDPQYNNIAKEIKMANEFLSFLREYFPNAQIVFKEGNHEERWTKWLWQNQEIKDIPDIQLENLLKCREQRIEFISEKRVIKAGALYIIHGHEVFASRGVVNIARTIRLKTNDNVIVNHFHVDQRDIIPTIAKEEFGCWAIPCVCGLHPYYRPINAWTNGFGIVNLSGDGTFEVEQKIIVGNKIK